MNEVATERHVQDDLFEMFFNWSNHGYDFLGFSLPVDKCSNCSMTWRKTQTRRDAGWMLFFWVTCGAVQNSWDWCTRTWTSSRSCHGLTTPSMLPLWHWVYHGGWWCAQFQFWWNDAWRTSTLKISRKSLHKNLQTLNSMCSQGTILDEATWSFRRNATRVEARRNGSSHFLASFLHWEGAMKSLRISMLGCKFFLETSPKVTTDISRCNDAMYL